jgi:hypothetical protein
MRKSVVFLFAAMFWGAAVNAQEVNAQKEGTPELKVPEVKAKEHEACSNLNYPYQAHSSKELRAIAATCQSDSISRLYYNRAYHVDLLLEGETLSQIIALHNRDMRRHIEAYRFYIALLEAFAPSWYPDADARAAFLNKEYDRLGEVAELRLHGYDHLADVKEKQLSFP